MVHYRHQFLQGNQMESVEVRGIRVWMRQVMDKNGWSANRWASLAGTSPTNITRFLKDAAHCPSARTIAKLALVAGTAPSFTHQVIQQGEVNAVALYDTERNRLGVISVWGVKGEVEAYKLGVGWPDFQMSVDDILVVKRNHKAYQAGDTVVAIHDDRFLVLRATSEKNKFISDSVVYAAKDLEIKGLVVQVIRNLHD